MEKVVNAFVDEKFPTVVALNKIDHPDADKVGFKMPATIARANLHRMSLKSQKCKTQTRLCYALP